MKTSGPARRDPLLGAAVLKVLLRCRLEEQDEAARLLYEQILRDLGLSDAEVERYLAEHADAVAQAIRMREAEGR